MDGDTDIVSLPLSSLPFRTRSLLSCLLNTHKIIPSEGDGKLPRDWRGLASLISISAELAANIHQYNDKTERVLEIWQQQDSAATVGHLLWFLECLDRYDVYEDVCSDLREYASRNKIAVQPQNLLVRTNTVGQNGDTKLITYDDRPGYQQQYHAFILYANEDYEFVNELMKRMGDEGFLLCTVDRLQAGHSTQYAPVSRLISQRCQRIILVFSPDFLRSPANSFYRDYAQALSIESSGCKIIPIMYRECQLPPNLAFYHRLHYINEGRAMYDFWIKLRQSLDQVRSPQTYTVTAATTSQNLLRITNMTSYNQFSSDFDDHLFLPSTPRHVSMNDLTMDTHGTISSMKDSLKMSLGDLGQASEGKKKQGTLKKILNTFKGKKTRKEMAKS